MIRKMIGNAFTYLKGVCDVGLNLFSMIREMRIYHYFRHPYMDCHEIF